MKANLILFVLIVLLFSGCRKLINIDENYVGRWSGRDGNMRYSLHITSDGGAEFERNFGYSGTNGYGHEHWNGPLKSNGKRFQIAYHSPWFIIDENPVLTNDDCVYLFSPIYGDTTFRTNNWRIKFRYPKTIGYDGAEVVMYRHQY